MGGLVRNETNRGYLYYTENEWIGKKPILLTAWQAATDKKAGLRSRLGASGTNKAKALLRRMDAEGRK